MTITIPGEPVAQGRGRAVRFGAGIRVVDPQKSRSWKGIARVFMQQAVSRERAALLTGPVRVRIVAVFSCPKTDFRKREPRERRLHAKRPDAENVAKAVLDAATGCVWQDDAQVCDLRVEKWIGAQGEAPCVVVEVSPAGEGGAK